MYPQRNLLIEDATFSGLRLGTSPRTFVVQHRHDNCAPTC